MIPDNIKKIIDEILDKTLSEMDGATSTTASAGGEYTGKYFLKKLNEKTPTLAAGTANISSYTKDRFKKVPEGMPSDSKIYDYKQFPSTPKPKSIKLYKESDIKFKVGQKVTYLDAPGEITAVRDYDGKQYVSVAYNKGQGRTKVSGVLSTNGDVKPLGEQLNEISYRRFNENVSKVTPERKITRALSEVKKRVKEIEQVIEYFARLKDENTVKKDTFWTSKIDQFEDLSERLHELSQNVKKLSK